MGFICPACGERFDAPGVCPRDGTPREPRRDPLLGETLGSWRLARVLGAGGMGKVYLGVQPSIGGRVAIKVLARECAENGELVERFFGEARAVNRIRHERIVNVVDLAWLPDGRPFIVMEHLEGAPLSQLIARHGPLPLGWLAHLGAEVLDAVGAAHAAGVVHRDLKPDNVFVTPGGHAKVLDFGIAKLAPELAGGLGPTQSGALLGTPHYMSPEQAAARPVDARSDLYALGVLLFEAATGRVPFAAPSLFELLRLQLEAPPPSPRALRPDIPPALEAVILRALEKDPARRHPSAAEMSRALRDSVAGLPAVGWTVPEPVGAAARTPAASTPTTTGSRRRRVVAVAAVSLACAGVGAAALWSRERAPEPKPAAPLMGVAPAAGGGVVATTATPAKQRFDVGAYVGEAEGLARAVHGDAALARIDALKVRPDGTSDTSDAAATVFYHFRSPARSTPGGECLVRVAVTPLGVTVMKANDDACALPIAGPPRCTPEAIHRRAVARGARAGVPLTMTYLELEGARVWRVVGDHGSLDLADACGAFTPGSTPP